MAIIDEIDCVHCCHEEASLRRLSWPKRSLHRASHGVCRNFGPGSLHSSMDATKPIDPSAPVILIATQIVLQ